MHRKANFVCCSDARSFEDKQADIRLQRCLAELGTETEFSGHMYSEQGSYAGTPGEKAETLMAAMERGDFTFDLSGGDLASEILDYLDFDRIAAAKGCLWGYSDLTSVLNAIYAAAGKQSVLYQIRNLTGRCEELQRHRMAAFFSGEEKPLTGLSYRFLRGETMAGVLVGGNIRCLLKLAGTEYFPDTEGKILLLEACSGGPERITAYFSQLRQMGVFRKAAGVLLGTFTQMERERLSPGAEELILKETGSDIPIAVTGEIGHGPDAKAAVIGKYYSFTEGEQA